MDDLSDLWGDLLGKAPDLGPARSFYGKNFNTMMQFHNAGYDVDKLKQRATQAGDIPGFGHPVCQDYRPQKV